RVVVGEDDAQLVHVVLGPSLVFAPRFTGVQRWWSRVARGFPAVPRATARAVALRRGVRRARPGHWQGHRLVARRPAAGTRRSGAAVRPVPECRRGQRPGPVPKDRYGRSPAGHAGSRAPAGPSRRLPSAPPAAGRPLRPRAGAARPPPGPVARIPRGAATA